MDSFSMHNEDVEQSSPVPAAAIGKRRLRVCCSVGALVVVAGTFFLGVGFGYEYHKGASANAVGGCGLSENENINDELALGLDKMAEWYPESSADIRKNKKDIIHYIASMTNPPSDSPLRTIALSHGRRLANRTRQASARGRFHSVTTSPKSTSDALASWNDREDAKQRASDPVEIPSSWNDRDDEDEEDDENDAGADDGLKAENCTAAVTMLIYDVLEFTSSFAWFTIPGKYRFRVRLLDWLNKHYDQRQFDAFVDVAAKFVVAKGAKEKSEVIFRLLRQAWSLSGGWLKLLFDWVMEHSRTPWTALKKCSKFAAQLAVWFGRGSAAFVGQASFQIMGAPKLISSAKAVKRICNKTQTII
jgi:hypothetical protein